MARFFKRERAYKALNKVGVFSLWRTFRKRRLLIVNYHRILGISDPNPFDDGVVSCTPEIFEKQIQVLTTYRNAIDLNDLIGCLNGTNSLPVRPLLITFDDGYADNFSYAFPILKKYNTGACFFLPTDRIANRQLEWWDHIAYILKQARSGTYNIRYAGKNLCFEIDTNESRRNAADKLIELAKRSGGGAHNLYESFELGRPDPILEGEHIMTDDQVSEILSEPGFSIGSHSVSHTVLSTLDEDAQYEELLKSKQFLESRFNVPINACAYPVGDEAHYSKTTIRAAERAGYSCAFNFRRNAKDVNLQDCDRFDIDRSECPDNLGGIFQARSAGFFLF